jgi:hypothetical protein
MESNSLHDLMNYRQVELKGLPILRAPSVQSCNQAYVPKLAKFKSSSKNRPVIVIDNGSYELRAGFSFDQAPSIVVRN